MAEPVPATDGSFDIKSRMPPDRPFLPQVPLKHWGRWVSALLIVLLLVALVFGAAQGDISYRDIPYYLVSPIILQGLVGTIVLAVLA